MVKPIALCEEDRDDSFFVRSGARVAPAARAAWAGRRAPPVAKRHLSGKGQAVVHLRPAGYDGTPVALTVSQDGHHYLRPDRKIRAPVVYDNLIRQRAMPATLAVFGNPGHAGDDLPDDPWPADNRSIEYDDLGDRYARFLLEELPPAVQERYPVTTDLQRRAIAGTSSCGVCAFTVAWNDRTASTTLAIGLAASDPGGPGFIGLIGSSVSLAVSASGSRTLAGNGPGRESVQHPLTFAPQQQRRLPAHAARHRTQQDRSTAMQRRNVPPRLVAKLIACVVASVVATVMSAPVALAAGPARSNQRDIVYSVVIGQLKIQANGAGQVNAFADRYVGGTTTITLEELDDRGLVTRTATSGCASSARQRCWTSVLSDRGDKGYYYVASATLYWNGHGQRWAEVIIW